jgi:hypothetical protein
MLAVAVCSSRLLQAGSRRAGHEGGEMISSFKEEFRIVGSTTRCANFPHSLRCAECAVHYVTESLSAIRGFDRHTRDELFRATDPGVIVGLLSRKIRHQSSKEMSVQR